MQRIPSLLRRLLPALALSAAAAAPAIAQAAYPEQPIKMIVAYAAGGGTDIIARLMAQYMPSTWATTPASS
jgi:tripartite-type tricarboxylate transporter receptor subunit TctC